MLTVGTLAAVAVAVASGYGYAAVTADNQTYTGCLQSGTLTNIAIGSEPAKACSKNATPISWSQTGPQGIPGENGTNGKDGASVTSAAEPAGANCADGGSKFTAASNNDTYACNGAKGDKGDPGGSTLAALEGSPCTSATGEAATVDVRVTQSGIVNMTCIAPADFADVSATFSGVGSMNQISIQDSDAPEVNVYCRDASECSGSFQKGHTVSIQFNADNQNFEYKCPQDPTTTLADANFITPFLTVYTGGCFTPLGLLDGGYTVTGTFLDS